MSENAAPVLRYGVETKEYPGTLKATYGAFGRYEHALGSSEHGS
jgi:hypothetical protein